VPAQVPAHRQAEGADDGKPATTGTPAPAARPGVYSDQPSSPNPV
jgi:hypothetical protein